MPKLTWPSAKFFQTIGLFGLGLGVRTAIKANSTTQQNKLAQQKLDELEKVIKEIRETVNNNAALHGNGNDLRVKQLVEQYYENLQNQVNQLYKQDQLSDITPQIQLAAQNVEAASNYLIKIQSELNNLQNYQTIERSYWLQEQVNAQTTYAANLNYLLNNLNPSIETKLKIYQIIAKNISNSKNNLVSNIWEPVENINQWLSTITYEQNIAFINLSGTFVIFVTLFSIIAIFYGDMLINYLKLEERYPKIAKYIILRRKFQQFYLLINIFIIFIVTIIMFVMNLTLF